MAQFVYFVVVVVVDGTNINNGSNTRPKKKAARSVRLFQGRARKEEASPRPVPSYNNAKKRKKERKRRESN